MRQRCGGGQLGWLGPRRAHHDQFHGEQGDDRVERSCRLDLGRPNQELSKREGEERADLVDRKDPPALRRLGLALSQLSVVMKSPAQPKLTTARRTSQDSGPSSSGIAAVAATTIPAQAA